MLYFILFYYTYMYKLDKKLFNNFFELLLEITSFKLAPI